MTIKKIYENVVLDNVNINRINDIPFIEIKLTNIKNETYFNESAYYFFDEENKEISVNKLLFLLNKFNKLENLKEDDISIESLAECLKENLGQQVVYIERIDKSNNSHQKKILKNLEINLLSKYLY